MNETYLNEVDHFGLAKKLGIDHGEAVVLAREFCPSGYARGEHGSLCPCHSCVTLAVLKLSEKG